MRQENGTTTLNFLYDANGMIGVNYNSANYYYLRNLQGDVIGIYDSNANVVARYINDAWGNILSVKDANGANITSSTHIANVNPIRYRGYYYDIDTKLYYLQSRYYNPEWGRFINADDSSVLDLQQSSATGTNLYAYCNNNPVMYSDPSGYAPSDGLAEFFRKVGMMIMLFFAGVNITTISNASGSYNDLATLYNKEIGGKAYPVKGITGKGTTYSGHGNARDFATSSGTLIYAAMGGTVTKVVMSYSNDYRVGNTGKMNECGNYIEITVADGTIMRYAHQLQSDYVKQGDVVIAGQVIGLVGSTGNSTGNHLHLWANQGDILDYFRWD